MLRAVILALLTLLAAAPAALAQASDPIDARIGLAPGSEPTYAGPEGIVRFLNATPGERYAWQLNLTANYTTFEVRARGVFDVERPRQAVPLIHLDEHEAICQERATRGPCDYTLFYQFPNERVWDVDGPARVFHVNGTADDIVLRLGIPGPTNATLVLERDVTPPGFALGEVANVTPISFYQETRTDEFALADLQVREKGTEEWIQNPTTLYHVLQRFPVQGLDPDTEHEARVVFTDWAGNTATSETYTVRTPPRPQGVKPVVTPLAPAPNSTVEVGSVVIRAAVDDQGVGLADGGLRLFFDLREVREDLVYQDGVLSYTPRTALAPGRHTVSVEATSAEGGTGTARWTFEVAGATRNESPATPALALVVLLALVALARPLTRR